MSPPSPPSAISGAWSLRPPLLQPWLAGVAPHFREPVPGEIQVPPPLPAPAGPRLPPRDCALAPQHGGATFSAPSSLPSLSVLARQGLGTTRRLPETLTPHPSGLRTNVPSGSCPREHSPAASTRPGAPATPPRPVPVSAWATGRKQDRAGACGEPVRRSGDSAALGRSSGRGVRLRSQGLRDNSRH